MTALPKCNAISYATQAGAMQNNAKVINRIIFFISPSPSC
jgi:hypothetical protein